MTAKIAHRRSMEFLERLGRNTRVAWRLVCHCGLLVSGLQLGCNPLHECASSDDYCEGSVLNACGTRNNMYSTNYWETHDCAAEGEFCVEGVNSWGSPVVFCSATSTPDPRCGDGVATTRCDTDTVIRCFGGYVNGQEECSPDVCVEFDYPQNYMRYFAECRDPNNQCFASEEEHEWICSGDVALECWARREFLSTDCPQCTLVDGQPVSQLWSETRPSFARCDL